MNIGVNALASVAFFKFDADKTVEQITGVLNSIDKTLDKALDLLTQNPQEMGELWDIVQKCSNVTLNVGLSLVALFFIVSFIFKVSDRDWRDVPFDLFFRELFKLILAKAIVEMSIDLCILLFNWGGDFMNQLVNTGISTGGVYGTLNMEAFKNNFNELGFWDQLWFKLELTTPAIILWVSNIIIQVICFGRVLQICLLTIASPLPLSTLAGETHRHTAIHFLKECIGVVLQGAAILLLLALYKGIVSYLIGSIGEIKTIESIWKLTMVTLVLIFGMLGSSKLGKMFFGS